MKESIETIPEKAMEYALLYERKKGRNPKDVSKTKCGYDIKSSGRRIEVKGVRASKPGFIILSNYNFRALQREENYWLYIICNVLDEPKVIELNKLEVLKRAKFKIEWDIPIWKIDWDRAKP